MWDVSWYSHGILAVGIVCRDLPAPSQACDSSTAPFQHPYTSVLENRDFSGVWYQGKTRMFPCCIESSPFSSVPDSSAWAD